MIRLLFLTTLCSFLSLTHPGLAENETGISPINNTATLDIGAHIKSFGTVILGGEPGLLERLFSNSSGRAYTGLSVTFTGPEAAAFSAELPNKIESYNDAKLRFRFAPQKVGPHGAKATLTWTGQTGPAPEFYLGGTGAYGSKATLDFPVNYGYTHTALAELSNGNVLMAGYRYDNPQAVFSWIRELRPDGTETGLRNKQTIHGRIEALAVQSDGKYLIAGRIIALTSATIDSLGNHSSELNFGQVFRFHPDGTRDQSFIPIPYIPSGIEAPLMINAIAIQPDGKIYLGGKSSLGDQHHLIRLNADGTPDTQPLPTPDGEVYALTVLADGRVMVGGAFESMSGSVTHGLARLKADGSLDSSFANPGFCFVTALASWSDEAAVAGLTGSLSARVVAPAVSLVTAGGELRRTRYFPTQSVPADLDAEGLKALSPTAVSMQAGGDVIAVHQPSTDIIDDTPVPVFHLQNQSFGGSFNAAGPRQFFQGKIHAALLQRDGKVLVAGEMTQATQYGAGVLNMIGYSGSTHTLLPIIPSSYLTGFAQLDVSGFVDYQPLSVTNGLGAYSDGLSTARLGSSPFYFSPGGGATSVTFTGPDADQFTVSQSYSWILPSLPFLPGPVFHFQTPDLISSLISPVDPTIILPTLPGGGIITLPIGYPSSQWIIHTKANRPGTLRAVAHIQNYLMLGSSQNTFDLALEATFPSGSLGHLEVRETSSPVALTSGALTQFLPTPVGSATQRTYLLKNNHAEFLPLELSVTGAQAGEFQLSTSSVILNPGQSTLVTATFKPTSDAGSQASLEIRIPYFSTTLGPRIDPDWHFEIRLQGTGTVARSSLITPAACIARVGESIRFEVPAFLGENLSYQWFRDEKPIPGATARVLPFDAVALADAASYRVRVVHPDGPALSTPARLVVLGDSPSSQSFVLGKPVKLVQPFQGTGLQFQWLKDGRPLSDTSQVKGSRTATLTLATPKLADALTYICLVTLGDVSLAGAIIQLDPIFPPAVTLAAERFDWTVGRVVTEQLSAIGPVTRFTVTGLPAGVRLNAATSALTGIPTKAGEFTLRITAANGSGSSVIREVPVTVTPLGLYETGTFMGLLARESFIGSGRGGLLNLSVTATGAYSGNLSYYTEPARRMNLVFKGQLEWNAEGKPVVRTLLNDTSKSSLEVTLGDLVGSIRLNTLTAGEIRRVITGRMEPVTFNTHLFSSRESPDIASGYARTSVTKTAISMVTGKVPAYGQIIALVTSTRACDDGLGLTLPIQIWLPKQETFSGWLPVPASSEAIQTTGELGLNYERFIGTPAIEFRFTPRSARFTPPAPGQSLLGPDGQTNTLKITFKSGETQLLQITPDNKITPEEGQTKWLTPVYGRHLQSASINPKTGFFSARTWNPSRYPEATLREGIIEGVTLNAQEKLRGILIGSNKEDPQPVPVEIEVVPGS